MFPLRLIVSETILHLVGNPFDSPKCLWWDSNPHSLRNLILSQARLPFHHKGIHSLARALKYVPDRSRTCKKELPSPAQRLACFPFHHGDIFRFPLAAGFPASKSIFSPVGFDSHNPFPALHKRSMYQFHHGEILLLPKESGSDRIRTCVSGYYPAVLEPLNYKTICFLGRSRPARTTLLVLYSNVKSKSELSEKFFEYVFWWDSNPHEGLPSPAHDTRDWYVLFSVTEKHINTP